MLRAQGLRRVLWGLSALTGAGALLLYALWMRSTWQAIHRLKLALADLHGAALLLTGGQGTAAARLVHGALDTAHMPFQGPVTLAGVLSASDRLQQRLAGLAGGAAMGSGPLLLVLLLLLLLLVAEYALGGRIDALSELALRYRNRLLTLNASSMAIRSPRLRFEVIGRILEEAARGLSAQDALLVLREGEEILVIPRAGRGDTVEPRPLPGVFLDPAVSGAGRALVERGEVVARNPVDPGFLPFLPETRFLPYVAVPVQGRERTEGVLGLVGGGAPLAADFELLRTLANQIGIWLETARLEERTQALEQSQELVRMKSRLLAHVSHELKTPLGLIKGYAQTLLASRKDLEDGVQEEFLRVIDEECDRLGETIGQFLEMSEIQAVGLRLRRERFLLQPLCVELVERFGSSGVELQIPGDLEMHGDPRRLAEVVLNLLGNARKYAPGGPVILAARRFGSGVRISVSDRGPAVPEEELGRIFDPFYRSPGGQAQRGSGLGLTICRAIMEAHDGRIWAEKRPEGGLLVVSTWPDGEEESDDASSPDPGGR